ncbi:MAG: hypothetical protein AAGI52_15855 [Bacteroidota bacterium]
MPRLLLVALVLSLLVPFAQAQERETPRAEGARALLFQIGPNVNLRSLDGATLSYKRHTSAERALRVGVTANAFADFVTEDGGGDRQIVDLAATLLALRYYTSDSPVALYTGIGPVATFRFDRVVSGDQTVSGVSGGGGVAGLVGVEWTVAEAISLIAEYGQSLTVEYADNPDTVRVRFFPTGARLGVSVYF